MDSADLRIFEAVARLGGISRAAQELNTVQSNVTARVRLLEEQIGTPLFERHARGVTLTAAGKRLLPYAEHIRALLRDANSAVRDDGTPQGLLQVGSLETTAAMHLAPMLTGFVKRWPLVDLVLRAGTSCELIDQVLNRELEGALVCGPVNHPDLLAETLFEEELVVLTAPHIQHLAWLPGAEDIRIVVLRASCAYRQKLETVLAQRGITGLRKLEFGTLEAVIACVAAGLGVTLLPRRMIGSVWQEGRVAVHSMPPDMAWVETQFIRRRDGYASSALEAFVAAAKEKVGEAIRRSA